MDCPAVIIRTEGTCTICCALPSQLVQGYQQGLSLLTQTVSGYISLSYETTGREDLYSVTG